MTDRNNIAIMPAVAHRNSNAGMARLAKAMRLLFSLPPPLVSGLM